MNRTVKIILAMLTVIAIGAGIAFRQFGVVQPPTSVTVTQTTAFHQVSATAATTASTTTATTAQTAVITATAATAPTEPITTGETAAETSTESTTESTTLTTTAAATEITTIATTAQTAETITTAATTTTTSTTAIATTAATTQAKTTETTTEATACCTLTVECLSVLDNLEHLKEGHEQYLPEDGYFLQDYTVILQEGDTVYDVLYRTCKNNRIKITSKNTAFGIYVSGIGHLDEFDVGKDLGWTSGWVYYVNGEFASVSCGSAFVQKGDDIRFSYSCKSP